MSDSAADLPAGFATGFDFSSPDSSRFDAVTKEQFDEGRARRFGVSNPEKMDIPFWRAMVESRCGAYAARARFVEDEPDASPQDNPIWCNARMGCSSTKLPDGTTVQIGGEHDDYYDPDFLIYNDVIVYHPNSTADSPKFDIYGYPEGVFPPTDFHTATYVPSHNAIFIIGNLGYPEKRPAGDAHARGKTPVYRLEIGTWTIEKVDTTGAGPGWIRCHQDRLQGDKICILGTREKERIGPTERHVCVDGKGGSIAVGDDEQWVLDLKTMAWKHEEQGGA